MLDVKLKNDTGNTAIVLKAGIPGSYRPVTTIPPDGITKCFVFSFNESETYREFVCVESESDPSQSSRRGVSSSTVILTSDDCYDYKEVVIKKIESKLVWDKTESVERKEKKGIITDAQISGAVHGVRKKAISTYKLTLGKVKINRLHFNLFDLGR